MTYSFEAKGERGAKANKKINISNSIIYKEINPRLHEAANNINKRVSKEGRERRRGKEMKDDENAMLSKMNSVIMINEK